LTTFLALRLHSVCLRTNNPDNVSQLTERGIAVIDRVPLTAGAHPFNSAGHLQNSPRATVTTRPRGARLNEPGPSKINSSSARILHQDRAREASKEAGENLGVNPCRVKPGRSPASGVSTPQSTPERPKRCTESGRSDADLHRREEQVRVAHARFAPTSICTGNFAQADLARRWHGTEHPPSRFGSIITTPDRVEGP